MLSDDLCRCPFLRGRTIIFVTLCKVHLTRGEWAESRWMKPSSSLTVLYYICLSVIGRDWLVHIPVLSHFTESHLMKDEWMNSLLRMADSSVSQNGHLTCMHAPIRHLVFCLSFTKPPAIRLHGMGNVKKIKKKTKKTSLYTLFHK